MNAPVAARAFHSLLNSHGKHFDIDYGYQCTLNLPGALLRVWLFCRYYCLTRETYGSCPVLFLWLKQPAVLRETR